MRIRRTIPTPPPPEFTMTFTRDEGWALVMSLTDAYDKYRHAADRDEWKQWAKEIDRELRR